MKFNVNWQFQHDGETYEEGDTFDDMTEKEAREAGLLGGVLSPVHKDVDEEDSDGDKEPDGEE